MNITKANVRVTYSDESVEIREFPVIDGVLTVKARDFLRTINTIDILADEFTAKAGEDGYFFVPNISPGDDNHASALVYFRERENARNVFVSSTMNIYAACHAESSVLAICEKMQHEYFLIVEVADGNYQIYPRFRIREAGMYEDIVFKYVSVEDSDWCAIARAYRKYQLDRGACRPLKERVKENEVLKKAARGIEIRCRLAHKKGYPDVPHEQTPENEPDINIEVPFARLPKVAEKLREKGCLEANFCLVGWNIGGQDGRDPQYFPVDPRLGGEAELRDAIARMKEMGYLVSAHTDPIISFNIADNLDHKDILHNIKGNEQTWALCSGGRSHVLCDKQSYEQYVVNYIDKLKDLGFYGLHYYDVLTILKPATCYNPAHPLNKKQVMEYRIKMLDHAREVFGGAASEGGFDYSVGSLDYALYPVISKYPVTELPATCDCTVPFWYLVYHGIVLYNAFPKTINAMLKGPAYELLGVEFGARPVAYLHGRVFEYEGEPNFLCRTDEELEENATLMGKAYERYMELVDLQYEYFEDYKILENGIVYTRYSNGSIVLVNHTDKDYVYGGKTVGALNYLRIDA